MKKLTAVIITLLLLMTSACTSSKIDAKQLYNDASAKMQNLNSLTVNMQLEMKIQSGEDGANIAIPMEIKMAIEGIKTGEFKEYTTVNTNIFGEKLNIQTWYQDAYLYINDGESKIKQATEIKDPKALLGAFNPDSQDNKLFDSIEAKTIQDGYELTLTLTKQHFEKLLKEADQDELLNIINLKDDIVCTMNINNEGYFDKMNFNFNMTTQGVEVAMVANLALSNFNQENLCPSFDPAEFIGFDLPAFNQSIDDDNLSLDDVATLNDLGFVGEDGVLSDGEYILDLINCGIMRVDEPNYIYDWDLYLAVDLENACTYDYEFNEYLEGEGCDFTRIDQLKAAYEELIKKVG